jgi:hypothetical protein
MPESRPQSDRSNRFNKDLVLEISSTVQPLVAWLMSQDTKSEDPSVDEVGIHPCKASNSYSSQAAASRRLLFYSFGQDLNFSQSAYALVN